MTVVLTEDHIEEYRQKLYSDEKSEATITKYIRDIYKFYDYLQEKDKPPSLWPAEKYRTIRKQSILNFKKDLLQSCQISSANSILTTVNSFLSWLGKGECRVRLFRVQRSLFCPEEKELTRKDYEKLLQTARKQGKRRLYLIMQTICSSGIRISELEAVTVRAVNAGYTRITSKGNTRTIFLPGPLRKQLLEYIKEQKITAGPVFVTRGQKPVDRSNVWKEMKNLCLHAGVARAKVFPHNLRHLFARTYYQQNKDVVRLADILGHASVDTTRIYTISSGKEHRREMERLGLTAEKTKYHIMGHMW